MNFREDAGMIRTGETPTRDHHTPPGRFRLVRVISSFFARIVAGSIRRLYHDGGGR
jgi:hypothetical protein